MFTKTTLAALVVAGSLCVAGTAVAADPPDVRVGESVSESTMSDAQAAAYMAGRSAEVAAETQQLGVDPSMAAARTHFRCGTINYDRYLYIAGAGTHVADVWNHTTRCWYPSTNHLVTGSIRVDPQVKTAFSYSSADRWIAVGYPFGYKWTRRNTCVHSRIEWGPTLGYQNWNVYSVIQVRGSGSWNKGVSKCMSNMSQRSF